MALIKISRAGRPLYRVRWNYQRDPNTGKRSNQERSFRNLKEAKAFDARVNAGTTSAAERNTVRSILATWRSTKRDAWQLRTIHDYEQHCRLRIEPYLGGKRLSAVTPDMARQWKAWMVAQGHGPRVCNKAIQTLKAANRWARGQGLSQNTMLDDVPLLDAPPPKPARPLTPSQVAMIANACTLHRDATLINVGAYSGLRAGELRALQWGDVLWDNTGVLVQRSMDRDCTAKLPKNGTTRNVLVLGPGWDALTAWHEACANTGPEDWVFPAASGKPLWSSWYGKNLAEIRAAADFEFDLHELRDTYASILIAAGLGEAEVTMYLGHSSVEITVRRYARLFSARRPMVAAQANALIPLLG